MKSIAERTGTFLFEANNKSLILFALYAILARLLSCPSTAIELEQLQRISLPLNQYSRKDPNSSGKLVITLMGLGLQDTQRNTTRLKTSTLTRLFFVILEKQIQQYDILVMLILLVLIFSSPNRGDSHFLEYNKPNPQPIRKPPSRKKELLMRMKKTIIEAMKKKSLITFRITINKAIMNKYPFRTITKKRNHTIKIHTPSPTIIISNNPNGTSTTITTMDIMIPINSSNFNTRVIQTTLIPILQIRILTMQLAQTLKS